MHMLANQNKLSRKHYSFVKLINVLLHGIASISVVARTITQKMVDQKRSEYYLKSVSKRLSPRLYNFINSRTFAVKA